MFIRTERSVKEFFSFYPVVSIIVIVNLFLWLMIDVLQFNLGSLIYELGIGHNLSIYLYGEYWRLVTPVFLHAGFSHLLFNSFALILFGPALEQMLGRFKFIIAYLLMGIAGNVGTYIINPTSQIPHLGASGSLYGIFGIYIFMVFFRKSLIDHANAQIIKTIFVIGLVMTFITPRINIAAHIFGFIGGFALGPLLLAGVLPFSIARNRKLTFKSDSNSDDVSFNPDRWKRKPFISKRVLTSMLWIALGVLVIVGFISQLI